MFIFPGVINIFGGINIFGTKQFSVCDKDGQISLEEYKEWASTHRFSHLFPKLLVQVSNFVKLLYVILPSCMVMFGCPRCCGMLILTTAACLCKLTALQFDLYIMFCRYVTLFWGLDQSLEK